MQLELFCVFFSFLISNETEKKKELLENVQHNKVIVYDMREREAFWGCARALIPTGPLLATGLSPLHPQTKD